MPAEAELDALAALLNGGKRVTLFCGRGCAGAHAPLMQLAEALKSPIVHALGGKEHVEYDNPYDVGMTGLHRLLVRLRRDAWLRRAADARAPISPTSSSFPTDAKIAQVDIRPENLGRRARLDLGLVGDVGATIDGAAAEAHGQDGPRAPRRRRSRTTRRRAQGLDDLATGHAGPASRSIRNTSPRSISDAAADDAVFTFDVGTPTIWAARYLKMNGRRRLVGSLVHGSMANAMPQAIGIQAAQPGRQVISLSGDGGFTMLMGDLITLTQQKLPVKVVIFNNGVLGFVALEMKAAGFVETGVDLRQPRLRRDGARDGHPRARASRIRASCPAAVARHAGP